MEKIANFLRNIFCVKAQPLFAVVVPLMASRHESASLPAVSTIAGRGSAHECCAVESGFGVMMSSARTIDELTWQRCCMLLL